MLHEVVSDRSQGKQGKQPEEPSFPFGFLHKLFFRMLQGSPDLIPVGIARIQRIVLSRPAEYFVHIVIYILHTPISRSLFFTIFCSSTRAFDKLDLEVPTEIPNWLAIS